MTDLELCQLLWPLQPPTRTRTLPMRVLALGMPRTGTDSLRAALEELGYSTYHGFNIGESPGDCIVWAQLHRQKEDGMVLDAAAFDRVLGDCQAVADTPGIVFAGELVRAYPEARVVVNYRGDLEAWHKSIVNVVKRNEASTGGLGSLAGVCKRVLFLFNSQLFWIQLSTFRTDIRDFWRGDIVGNAREVYEDHYRLLERVVPKERMLRWKVQDGWKPLCEFLGKPVPDKPFPWTNNVDEHDKALMAKLMPFVKVAVRNLVLFLVVLVGGLAYLWKYYSYRY